MANNLRKFATVAAYQAAELIKPAVSLIEENDDVYFDQKEVVPTFGGLTVKYYIEDPTSEVTLFNGGGGSSTSESSSESESESGSGSGGGGVLPSKMYVDGVEETPINTWRFETAGEHIVQYEFEDNAVPENYFYHLSNITGVIVGDDITEIGQNAFNVCPLTSATIGTGVTTIGELAFYDYGTITGVTIKATTPPTLGSNALDSEGGIGNDYPIYVPEASVNAYKTAWSAYASRIEAIQ